MKSDNYKTVFSTEILLKKPFPKDHSTDLYNRYKFAPENRNLLSQS